MVILITGASHTGKTLIAQNLLKKYKFPYFCIDHLKMGLIRSGNTELTPEEDEKLTEYLWPIVREMVKTMIENGQNFIIEGDYIPFDWKEDFSDTYLKEIKYYCLVMSESYIEAHFDEIKKYANVAEKRKDDNWVTKEFLLRENARNLQMCKKYDCDYILIDGKYCVNSVII